MSKFSKYLKKHYKLFIIAVFFLSIETTADLLQPLLISKLIDQGVMNLDINNIKFYGGLMLLVTMFGMVGALMRNWMATRVSYTFARELREDLYRKVLTLSMSQVEGVKRGSLITRLTSDVNQLMMFVNGLMRIFLKAPLLAIGSFIMVLNLNNKFVFIYASIIPVVIAIVMINLKIGYPLYNKIQKVLDRLNQKTMEFLRGIRTVRSFNMFDYEYETFSELSGDYRSVNTKTMRIMALFSPIVMLLVNLAVVLVLFFSRQWITQGEIGVGEIVAFSNYMTQFYFAMSIITRIFNVFIRAKTSATRVSQVLEIDGFYENESDKISQELEGNLHFKNVSFSFGQGEPVLKDINFEIQVGEKIGILGATGSGKTTLLHLMNGNYQRTSGEVYIGNKSIDDIPKADLSDLFSYVSQKTLLFSGSIKENLSFGKRGLSDEAYEQALEDAMINDFVQKSPQKLEAPIGRNGINVSGGQKQRLSIARALIHDAKIVMLDDSTSAVDVITERKIKEKLKKQSHKTVIIVAQKVSSVQDLDRIMVLNEGQIMDFDNHENLLKNNYIYREVYEAEIGKKVSNA